MQQIIDQITKMNLFKVIEKYISIDLEDLINIVFEKYYKDKDIKDTLNKLKRDDLNRTKKRWFTNAIKNYEAEKKKKNRIEIDGEAEFLLRFYEQYGENLFEQEFSKYKSPESIISSRIAEIKEWSESETKFLTDYRYINQKTKLQIEKAIEIDIAILIGNYLKKSKSSGAQVYENSLVDLAFFGNTRGKVSLEEETYMNEDNEYYRHKYTPDKNMEINVLVDKDYVMSKENKVSDLDPMDYKIFLEVMRHRDELFATQKLIIVKIGDLVSNIYSSGGMKNYMIVEERLKKMRHFSITKQDNKGNWSAIGIFSDVNVIVQPNGTKVAEIYVTEAIYKDYIQKQTVRIYKEKVDNLTQNTSQHLIFIMQKERLICYKSETNYAVTRDYTYFAGKIRFKKKRKNENLKELEAALSELVEQNIVVKSYKRIGEVFQIQFHPINEQEVQDLLEGNYDYTPLENYSNTLIN
ncbi:hypothetical protein AB1284_25440 [Bacillus sp. S2(2024)]|uniref:hypothetical protein n=1 Tax=Bacillus sp. S2(2024) TaxID=3162887 RepID=UPI003D20A9EA